MTATLEKLIHQLSGNEMHKLSVIPTASPVISFGDYNDSIVATMGLNPSDREFLDTAGKELSGELRRFHTLNSLKLNDWANVSPKQLSLIEESYRKYFSNNPYDMWFRDMEYILSGTGFSLYQKHACHLDLVPYATKPKWGQLSSMEKESLLELSRPSLEGVLVNSNIQLIILNGKSVVKGFEELANICFESEAMPGWDLPRKNSAPVKGFAYKARINNSNFTQLNREVLVLGYNHNLQSCFGVTSAVKKAIKKWVAKSYEEEGLDESKR